uniref:Myb/SANT-like domain-containing protein n=1 Tax=Chenopodium quinoa TaxID=63459 RepID=A0A803LET2_CHEQI
MEPERGLSTQKSSKMTNVTKGIVIGAAAAVIACSLAFLNELRSKTRRLRIIRQPYINRDSLRSEIVNSVLYCGDDTHCLGQIRIRPQAFFNLCNILVERGLLKENIRIGVKEQIISEKFQTNCTSEHVENHMKTVRNAWVAISTVQNNSGFGWNDNLKMVTASPTAYATYVKCPVLVVSAMWCSGECSVGVLEYPKYEKFLNRKIDVYEEMAIVLGNDLVRGNFSKTFANIDVDASMESGQPSMTIDSVPSKAESGTSLGSRPHRKRSRIDEGSKMEHISAQLQKVVSAIKIFSNNQLDVEKLYDEIIKMEDIEEGVRVAAFDHLVEREMLAKAFLTKSLPLRKLWMEKFVKDHKH